MALSYLAHLWLETGQIRFRIYLLMCS